MSSFLVYVDKRFLCRRN